MENFLWLVAGLILLVWGGELLVKGAVALSLKVKLSRMVIGMTVVSFATSLPELIVSLMAGLSGHPDISLSNVVGSNIANIGLVLGLTALLMPIAVKRVSYVFNWPGMMIISFMLYYFLVNDQMLSAPEGMVLFVFLLFFVFFIIRHSYKTGDVLLDEVNEELDNKPHGKIIFWLIAGAFVLWLGSKWLLNGAVGLARDYGISERIIGISMIAVGTSIPELAASLISAYRKERDISLGNLIGSNIFNIGSVLGITAIIHPIANFDHALLDKDILWMLLLSFLVIPLAWLPQKNMINRWKGALFLILYIVFIITTFS